MNTKRKLNPSLEERMAAHFDDLSRSEKAVVQFFTEQSEQVMIHSAVEIAKRLGTSDATVIRAAQSLGYSGLGELRVELAATLFPDSPPELRLSKTLTEISNRPEDALMHSLAVQKELVEQAAREINPEDFKYALELIHNADRTCVFGIGPSASIAQYFVLRLTRFGRQALAITNAGIRLADSLIALSSGDVLVALAFGRVTLEVDVTTRYAKNKGIPIILFSDHLSVALKDRISVAIKILRGGAGQITTIGNNIAVLDAFLLAIAAMDQETTVAATKELNSIRAMLVNNSSDEDNDQYL